MFFIPFLYNNFSEDLKKKHFINSILYLDIRLDFQGHFGHLNVICIYLSSQDSLASISFLGLHNDDKVCLRSHSYYSCNNTRRENQGWKFLSFKCSNLLPFSWNYFGFCLYKSHTKTIMNFWLETVKEKILGDHSCIT